MASIDQIRMHLGCLKRGNWRKPNRAIFHLRGIFRAIRSTIDHSSALNQNLR